MSKSWKCTICGSTMLSKCPSQRSIFMSPMESILNSVLTVNRVMPLKKNGCAELFVSYTTGGTEKTTGQTVKSLIDILTENPGYLENLGCNHRWVLNSETETECSLGCTHSNISTPIPAESNEEKPQTLKHMMRDYYSVMNIAIEQARLNVNISKEGYDIPVEEDFTFLKRSVGTMLDKIGKGEHLQQPYRVRIPGKSWRDASGFCFFDTKEDAVKYCVGVRLLSPDYHIELDKLDDTQETYKTEEFEFQIPCCICGTIKDDEMIIRRDGSIAHVKCLRAQTQDAISRKRMGTVRLGRVDLDSLTRYGECFLSQCERNYDLSDCYTYTTGRRNVTLRIFKTCTKDEMKQVIECITSQFAQGWH